MRVNTRKRRNARRIFEQMYGRQELIDRMYQIISQGKQGLDAFLLEVGRMMAETIMYIEREEISGPEYRPLSSEIKKWASQRGSIYLGDQKISVEHPRLRGKKREIALESYQKLKEPGAFSEELLCKILRGISAQRYQLKFNSKSCNYLKLLALEIKIVTTTMILSSISVYIVVLLGGCNPRDLKISL